jgi:hypothetical protein
MQSVSITTKIVSSRRGVLDTTLCDKVCQWLAAGRWFSLDTPIFSTNKSDHHDITEILLKVVSNTITLTPNQYITDISLNHKIMKQMALHWKNVESRRKYYKL